MTDHTNQTMETRGDSDRTETRRTVDKLRDEADNLARDARSEAHDRADGVKAAVADQGRQLSDKLEEAGDQMTGGTAQQRLTRDLAGLVASSAQRVENADLDEVIKDLKLYARRQPATFLACASLVGFAAVRFARAEPARRSAGVTGAGASSDPVSGA